MVHDIGKNKLRKNNPTKTSFAMKLNDDARSFLYIILFHALNAIGVWVAKILDMDECMSFEQASLAVCRTRFVRNSENRRFYYPAPASWEGFFHEHI